MAGTGQPGQASRGKSPKKDQPGQLNYNRSAGTGQLRQISQDRTARTENQDKGLVLFVSDYRD
jgi:hypothetical protein